MTIPKIITDSGITLYIPGSAPFQMSSDHSLYSALIDAVKDGDVNDIKEIVDLAKRVKTYVSSDADVQFIDGEMFYKGEAVSGALVERILQMMNKGFDVKPMITFFKNLQQNPSYKSRENLYRFLEHCGDLPITDDGHFIAYKWVRNNYHDVHSGKFDNSVGKVVSMPRSKVDDDSNQTCSTGLHVCSNGYVKFGDKLMLVKVNPRDVVSVPYDYDNAKMRVCEYKVIEEVSQAEYVKFNDPVYNTQDEDEIDEDDCDDCDDTCSHCGY